MLYGKDTVLACDEWIVVKAYLWDELPIFQGVNVCSLVGTNCGVALVVDRNLK